MELSRLTTLQLRSLDELWLKWGLRGKKKEKKRKLKQSCKPEPSRSIYRSRKLARDLTYTLIAASFPMLNQKSWRSTESQLSYTGRLRQFSFYTSPTAILILKYTWRIQRFYDQSSLIECLQLRDSKTSSQSIVAKNVKDWNNFHKWVCIFQISTKISRVMPPLLH